MVETIRDLASLRQLLALHSVVVLDCYATWCGPCRAFAPTFENMARKHKGEAFFCKADVDEAEDLASALVISAMPTFVVFKNGKEVARVTGADQTQLTAALFRALA